MFEVNTEQANLKHPVKVSEQAGVHQAIGDTWSAPLSLRTGRQLGTSDSCLTELDCGSPADLYGKENLLPAGGKGYGATSVVAERFDGKPDAQEGTLLARSEHAHLKVENRGASPEYARTVENGLSTLPDRITPELEAHGVKVYVFMSIQEYDKAFGTHKADLPNASNAPSLFDKSSDPPRIAVFERLADGTPVKDFRNYSPAGLGRHEVGHAHSFINGELSVNDKDFTGAYLNDLNDMPPAKMAQLRKEIGTQDKPGPLRRYLSEVPKSEFYAELFAMATGGGSDLYADQRFRYYFPKTVDQMNKEFKQ